jgi:polyisoprenoid-binding protein YceI
MRVPPILRQRRTWLIGVPVAVLLVAVVGPWLYVNVLRDDPPEPLSFADVTSTTGDGDADADTTTTTAASPADSGGVVEGIEGTWTVGAGSQAGYRVKEVLFGQDAEAVGRTTEVTGTLQIVGTTVTSAGIEVDMASVTSDESRRDGQFRGRIMDTDTFPTATFTLTEPVDLGAVPADGEEVGRPVTGELTLRGVTRTVTVDLTARRNGAAIEVTGAIAVAFDDFDIPDASGGPAQVGRDGQLELLLVLAR